MFIKSVSLAFLASELFLEDKSSRSAIANPGTAPLNKCPNIIRTIDSVRSLLKFTLNLAPPATIILLSIDSGESGLFTGSTNVLSFMLAKNCCIRC